MPDLLVSLEIAAGVLIGVLLAYLAAVVLRRRTIARGRILTLCGLRRPATGRWRTGLVRFGNGTLEWFTLGGVSLRPKYRWNRADLDLDAPVDLGPGAGPEMLSDAVAVSCRLRDDSFELALQRPAYTALRAWIEAAPPGGNTHRVT